MINRIVLVGTVVADPEERAASGTTLSKFRIAVDRVRRGRDGEREADFFNVVAFGRTAEFCNRYLAKADVVGVDGRLQIDQYKDRDGNRQTWIEVCADNVQKLSWDSDGRGRGGGRGRDSDDEDGGRGSRGSRGASRSSGRPGNWDHGDDFDDADAPADERQSRDDDRGPQGKEPRDRDREASEGRRQSYGPRDADDAGQFDQDDDPFADN